MGYSALICDEWYVISFQILHYTFAIEFCGIADALFRQTVEYLAECLHVGLAEGMVIGSLTACDLAVVPTGQTLEGTPGYIGQITL